MLKHLANAIAIHIYIIYTIYNVYDIYITYIYIFFLSAKASSPKLLNGSHVKQELKLNSFER